MYTHYQREDLTMIPVFSIHVQHANHRTTFNLLVSSLSRCGLRACGRFRFWATSTGRLGSRYASVGTSAGAGTISLGLRAWGGRGGIHTLLAPRRRRGLRPWYWDHHLPRARQQRNPAWASTRARKCRASRNGSSAAVEHWRGGWTPGAPRGPGSTWWNVARLFCHGIRPRGILEPDMPPRRRRARALDPLRDWIEHRVLVDLKVPPPISGGCWGLRTGAFRIRFRTRIINRHWE